MASSCGAKKRPGLGGWRAHPFDLGGSGPDADDLDDDLEADRFREECGVFGVFGAEDAAKLTALGLHALQHRGTEAAGIVAYDQDGDRFSGVRRFGIVRDNFTAESVLSRLGGRYAIGHNRYSTAGSKGQSEPRDIQPLYAELAEGGVAIAHNGNFTNADEVRAQMESRGSIFQSRSDTECVLHLMARSYQRSAPEKLKEALRRIDGAFSVVALTSKHLIGVRDPRGVRPLVLGRLGDAHILASETVALDIVNAELVREVEPGEMVVIDRDGLRSYWPFEKSPAAGCIFEFVYFARPDSEVDGMSVYEVRRRIGEELAREHPVEADLISPVPDSGIPAAIGFANESGIPFGLGVIKNQYVGRTFIEPTQQIRNMGARLKLNANRALVRGKRVVLVDDSVVRGTTSRKLKDLLMEAGAAEVHFRVASPPTVWPCFYGVDTPQRDKLMAAQMSVDEMCRVLGFDSLRYVSLDGLYRACGRPEGRKLSNPGFCDACFSGFYPIEPTDSVRKGLLPPPEDREEAADQPAPPAVRVQEEA